MNRKHLSTFTTIKELVMEDELNAEQVDADDIYDEDFEDYEDDGFESEEQEDDEPNVSTLPCIGPMVKVD